MHPRNIILIQASSTVTVIILAYVFFIQPKALTHQPTHHIVPIIPIPYEKTLSITKLMGCWPITPPIHIFIFANDPKRVNRLVLSLDSAAYSQTTVNLTIVGDDSVVQRLKGWRHGAYRFATKSLLQLHLHSKNALVILLDDHVEPSPLYALWFLIQHCQTNASAIAGGGNGINNVAGLAIPATTWNSFVQWTSSTNHTRITTALVVDYLSSLSPNASMVFPSIGSGNAFVRSEWQSPAYVEHAPKLTRTWDPVKEPSWGAVEIWL